MNVNKFPVHLVYAGPSRYNGEPIRAYIYAQTGNSKTGMIAGLVVVPEGMGYWTARKTGGDAAVCGGCRMRSKASGGDGTCYVGNGSQVGMGLKWLELAGELAVDLAGAARLIGMFGVLRSAVWGDAAALPESVWAAIEAISRGQGVPILGYTHGWRTSRHLVGSHMASVDSAAEAAEAQAVGWRTFLVAPAGTRPERSEFACPASAERGKRLTCVDCLACGTDGYRRNARSVVIWKHDSAGQHAIKRTLATLSIAQA